MSGPKHPGVPDGPGPLDGLRVVELASEWTAFAGKLLGELGAEVILVEPPEGSPLRAYGPFLADQPGSERSLWWWHYQSSKLGVTLDLSEAAGRDGLHRLANRADIVLEGDDARRLAGLGLDHPELRAAHPELIWVSITPFGRDNPRSGEPATDLTILAGGGPVWSCGYDDHGLPPVRGGGNQALHTAGLHAVAATLVAVIHRSAGESGQHVDVSMHAAANVTTEAGSYQWLVAQGTVQRQTGRHASQRPTAASMAVDVDGRPVNTGFPPTSADGYRTLIDWLEELDVIDQFPDAGLLQLGVDRGGVRMSDLAADVETQAVYGAAREALVLVASRLSGYQFFLQGQRRGLPVGVIYAPEEVLEDPHFVATGFATPVWQAELGDSVAHAGSGLTFERSPWRIARPAPRLGEHNDVIEHIIEPAVEHRIDDLGGDRSG